MLILATSCRQIRFAELMEVYTDSNLEKASRGSGYPAGFALQMAEQDHRQYLQDVFFPTEGAILAIWEEKGRYVSALRLEPYKDGLLLAGLETAPDRRKMGYAVLLIQAVLGHLGKQGSVKVYSHVDKKNIPSRKTHEKCGFQMISDRAVYIDGSVDHRCCTLCYEV